MPRLSSQPIRFGIFEVDLREGELRRRGLKINLQPQPFQILASLLERSGEVVTLEELRRKIWPPDTFVNFNSSMRTAINRIRQALGDSGRSPRFIETLSRRGYRFIMPTGKLFEARQAFGERQPERVRLAVLPFDDLGSARGQTHFTDGLTEEITTQLGRLDSGRVGVISPISTMRYNGTLKVSSQIGQGLGVHYVIKGCVRHARKRVRISVHLIRVSDQTQLWAEGYESELGNVFSLQEQVARRVVRCLAHGLLLPHGRRLGLPVTTH